MIFFHPEFKPSALIEFLDGLFDHEEDVTGIYPNEKTVREEGGVQKSSLPFLEPDEETGLLEVPRADDTQVVDPEKMDFRSVFDEIGWEDESRLQKPDLIALKGASGVFSNLKIEEDEEYSVTGVLLPLENPLPMPLPSPDRKKNWKRWGAILLVFVILAYFYFRIY